MLYSSLSMKLLDKLKNFRLDKNSINTEKIKAWFISTGKQLLFTLKNIDYKKLRLSKKSGIYIGAVILVIVVSIAGRKSPVGNDWESVLPDSEVFSGDTLGQTEESDIYMAFFFEVFDLVKNKFWNQLTDEQLGTITKLAVERVSEIEIAQAPTTRDATRAMLQEQMKDMSDEQKEEFLAKVTDIVLANLEPFGRSRLYTQQKRTELANTVNNIKPEVNHYDNLEVTEEASPEEITKAYEDKKSELEAQPQTPEVQKEIQEVEKAFEVVGDQGNKNLYDQAGINPTIDNRLITPNIFYIHITKFSPTTVEELQRVMDKVDNNGANLDTLIIDLRGNIGGAIDGLPYFLGPFIGQNQYAYQFFSRGEREDFITKTGWMQSLVRYKKVVILTDGGAQSSAEVFAATLKKYNVGVTVGTPTKGWGTVESVFKINNQMDPENEVYSVLLVHSLTLKEDGTPIEGNGVQPLINITSPNWEVELNRYFNNQEILNAVRSLVN